MSKEKIRSLSEISHIESIDLLIAPLIIITDYGKYFSRLLLHPQ